MSAIFEIQGTWGPTTWDPIDEFPAIDMKVGDDFVKITMQGNTVHGHIRIEEGSLMWHMFADKEDATTDDIVKALKSLRLKDFKR